MTFPQDIERILTEAQQLYRAGKTSQAQRLCERVLAHRPNHSSARHLLAMTCLAAGNLPAAIGSLELLLADEPGNADVHHSLGGAFARAGRVEDAKRHLEQATTIDPRNIDSYVSLAQLHLKCNRPKEAEASLRQALSVAPDHSGVLNNLGSLLADHGNPAEGLQYLRHALAKGSENAVVHYNIAKSLKQLDMPELAIEHYRKAVRFQPDLYNAWHNLGNLWIDLGRKADAAEAYGVAVKIKRRPEGPWHPPDQFRKTTRTKLLHDIEQLQYLIERQILPGSTRKTVTYYKAALAALPEATEATDIVDIPRKHLIKLAPTYNRLIYWKESPALSGPVINPRLDTAGIEAEYLRNRPGYATVDKFLTPEALAALRRFCLESTIWFHFRYTNGYLGAFMDDGFCCPLLLQIAEELRRALPGIFGNHMLRKLWAYKYDSRLSGIPIHADFAAVNVNFWITPDEANLDPKSGGLIFWDKEAPLEWDFETYNANEPAIRQFLVESGAKTVNVPHRQNRVAIFNSDLFHKTGEIRFREGYENRRINITMLFGKRGDANRQMAQCQA